MTASRRFFNRTLTFTFFISVLFLGSSLSVAHAATGDITGVRILGDKQHNGWTAEVDIEGLGTKGKYSFGLGTNGEATSSSRIILNVTSPGYDAEGNPTTIVRTIYGTKFVRQAYPNDKFADETVNGNTTTVRVSLSDFVYAGDSNVTANIAGGFYGSTTSSLPATNIQVTNNSTLTYPKVIGRWAWPGYERVTGDFLVEASIFNQFARSGKPVAAVKFVATDQHGNTSMQTVSEMTKSMRSGDANLVQVYAATMPVSSLTQGDVITVNFEAYPWVGDSSAVLNSAVGADGYAQPDERLGPLAQVNDKNGTYGVGYALVNVNGKSGTSTGAVVYPSQAQAEAGGIATAFTNIGKAAEAIKAYQTTQFGRANAGGGVVLLTEGSYSFPGYNPVADLGPMNTWLIIRPASNAQKANTIITGGSNAVFKADRVKVEGITIAINSSVATFKARAATDAIWFHNNEINVPSTGSMTLHKVSFVTQNSITALGTGFKNFSAYKSGYQLIRGNSSIPLIQAQMYTILGNKNILPVYIENGNGAGETPGDNIIFAYNSAYGINGNGANIDNQTQTSKGIAVVQNVLESLATVQPLLQLAADSSSATTTNVVYWNNSFSGERESMGYNEYGTTSVLRTNWSVKFNSFKFRATKTDTFGGGPPNGERIGNWALAYSVGAQGNFSRYNVFPYDFEGLNTAVGGAIGSSQALDPGYINNKSSDGVGGGYGDYRLKDTSMLIDLATSTSNLSVLIPYDFVGNSVYGSRDTGAYEYQPIYAMGSDAVNASTTIRVYGDGKFRNRTAPQGATVSLQVQPSGNNPQNWVDIKVTAWDSGSSTAKVWTEFSSDPTLGQIEHTIGGVIPNKMYSVSVDGVAGASIGGCGANGCVTNSSGDLHFTYTGGNGTVHTFSVGEITDTFAPVVSAINSNSTQATTTISWMTDEPASSQVSFGLDTNYSASTALDTSLVTSHLVLLPELVASTTYHYIVVSKDASGNTATSSDQTFTTTSLPDGTSPTISEIVATASSTSALVNWTTDEVADSAIEFGTTTSYGDIASSTELTTSHGITLVDLLPLTTYHFRILTSDASGNIATSSDQTFTTTIGPDVTPPTITWAPVLGWTTNEPADTQVQFGTTNAYGSSSPLDSSLVTSHLVYLQDLASGTTYHYRLVSRDGAGNVMMSPDLVLVTP